MRSPFVIVPFTGAATEAARLLDVAGVLFVAHWGGGMLLA